MVAVIGYSEGHYEVQEVEFGRVYRWCPEYVELECDCGERLTLTFSVTRCWCGLDHGAVVREELPAKWLDDEALHPWRYAGGCEDVGLPC
jgi:hypothetical protein